MSHFCTSCGTELLDNATFCTTCGIAAATPISHDCVSAGRQEAESSSPGGADVPSDLATGSSPTEGAKPARFSLQVAHKIAAGATAVAVLAGVGVGVTAIDYPFRLESAAPPRAAIPAAAAIAVAMPPPAVAKLAPQASVSTTPAEAMSAPAAAASAEHGTRAPKAAKRAVFAKMAKRTARKTEQIVMPAAVPPAAVAMVKPPSIDERYNKIVKKECSRSTFGFLCREAVKWRLCNGRWNDGNSPGEKRCYVEKKGGGFPLTG